VLDAAVALRPLPWRATRDPWAVLVSECMLQQTQAARVHSAYLGFLERFPTPAACAGARPGEVVRAWAGLGYNRRAVRLHACAVEVVRRHGGVVPGRLDALLALPGVGPYTARAVLAFAYEQPVAVVDTNVRRVLSRMVAGVALEAAAAQALADQLVVAELPWGWNQAVLEFGQTLCTPRRPRCPDCPARRLCAWARAGHRAPDPGAPRRRQGRLEGSDRQGRGRLLDALRLAPVAPGSLAAACGWPADPRRARRVADALVGEGLARRRPGGVLELP
jgi:A/G-specific adenine glycosylase